MESSGITDPIPGPSPPIAPPSARPLKPYWPIIRRLSMMPSFEKYAKQWIRPRIIQQIEEIEAALPAAADPAAPRDRVAQGQAAFIVARLAPTRPH